MRKIKQSMVTVAFAMSPKDLGTITKQLDSVPFFDKRDTGKDDDGHVIEYFYKGDSVFFAMVGTHGRYLVRAVDGLINVEVG